MKCAQARPDGPDARRVEMGVWERVDLDMGGGRGDGVVHGRFWTDCTTGRWTTRDEGFGRYVLRPESPAAVACARWPGSGPPLLPHALRQPSVSFVFVLAAFRIVLIKLFFVALGSAEHRAQVLPRVVRTLEHGPLAQDELQCEPCLSSRRG
ncbi:hypothetical protein EIP86_009222 [Pleurotus ostreatoroseus]|nr:hypothetical protein EIP86_009222 [Pleurotus ostreatoroseus]